MSLALTIQPEARSDLEDAYRWYEAQQTGLGGEFIHVIEAKLQQVEQWPKQFPRVRGDIRRAVVLRFPYSIFFVEGPERIDVLAVLHQARNPKEWPEQGTEN